MADESQSTTALVGRPTSVPEKTQSAVPVWAAELRRWQDQLTEIFPPNSGVDPQQYIRVVLTEVRNNLPLQEAAANDPSKFVGAVLMAARHQLEIGGFSAEAYLIPRYNGRTKQPEVVLQTSVRGLITVAVRSGAVSKLVATPVFDGDVFDVMLGTDEWIVHKPDFEIDRTDFERIVAFYAVATLPNGDKTFEVMTSGQVDAIRDRYAKFGRDGKPTGPWVDSYDQMGRKTVASRLVRRIPHAGHIGVITADSAAVASPQAALTGSERFTHDGGVEIVSESTWPEGEEPFVTNEETS